MAVYHYLHTLFPELFSSSPPKNKNTKNTTFRKKLHISLGRFLPVGPEEGRSFFRNIVFLVFLFFGGEDGKSSGRSI
jgi:hypothetical protein